MHVTPRIDPAFKCLIPPLSDGEYRQLEQNILSCRKCRGAIILWDGIIIDGHNRFYICVKHGIEFEVKEMSFESREDAKLWIVENQLGRRNLTDAMRIELALCKEEMLRERAKVNQFCGGRPKIGEEKGFTKSPKVVDESINVHKTIADEASVGHGTLQRYMRIKAEGSPELLEKIKAGEIKIGTAYRMLPKELEKQLQQADKWYAYIAERVPFDDNEEGNRVIYDRLEGLARQLRALLEKLDELPGGKGDCQDAKD